MIIPQSKEEGMRHFVKSLIQKKLFVVSFFLIALIGFLSIFESDIISFYWRLKRPSPVEWENVKIHLDKNMIYKTIENGLVLGYWEGVPEGGLTVSRLDTDKPQHLIAEALAKKGYIILEADHRIVKGYNSSYIKYKERNNQDIKLLVFNKPLKLMLHYEGPPDNFSYFKKVIDNMEISNYSKK